MFVSSADTSVSASGGDDQSLTAGSTHGSVQLIDDRPLLGAQRKIPLKRSGSPRPQKKNMQLAHVPTPEADYQEVPEMGDQDVSQHHTLLTSDQDRWKSSYKAPRDSVSSVESLYFNRTDESDDSISPASSPPSVTMGRSTQPAAPAKRPAPSTTMGNSALKSLKRSAQEDSFTTEISSKGGSNSSAALSKVLPSKLAIPQEASKSAPQPDSLITPLNLDSDVFFNEPEHSRTISGEVNTVSDYLSLISGSPGQLDSESAALDLRASESFNQTNDTAPRRSHSRGKSNTTLNALDTVIPRSTSKEDAEAVLSRHEARLSWTPNSSSPQYQIEAPPLTNIHFECYQSHRSIKLSRNAIHPVPCMTCHEDNRDLRWACTWCYLRICGRCMEALSSFESRDLRDLVAALKQGSGRRAKTEVAHTGNITIRPSPISANS